ncbi:TIGR03943 family protein [Clostridium sp.]|uniref:TIGR03943 family putative permease subunit n=1 Tax=Clostridium sp. TaxID=1506 RepID=UPI001A3672C1|nr:TIGR03943 family protein [Clostridium sp.]MBK5242403.1 TIGR03943 family protein [Clostridium sp.]
MKKKLNLNELIWFFILVGFTYYFYMIISTNKINLYVHPKMVKYVKFALYFFIVLTVVQGKNIFSIRKNKRLKIGFMMFLIPITLGFLFKSEGLSAYNVINKGFSLTSQLKINTLKHKHITLDDGTELCEHNDDEYSHLGDDDYLLLEEPLDSVAIVKGETISMTSENFMNFYENIYGKPYDYVGRTINIKGFIYKQNGLNKDEFILSRILVSCCTADAQLVGLLCDYSKAEVLTEGTWVNIEGTLEQHEYIDDKYAEINMIPIIKVNKIEQIEVENNEYIYN